MTDITELAQRLATCAKEDTYPVLSPADCGLLVEALEKAQAINAAAEKLVRCKGRYHSEQNYRALAALFGVTTPDLPPLDSESRTVTVKLSSERFRYGESDYDDGYVNGWNARMAEDTAALDRVGIKWEAE